MKNIITRYNFCTLFDSNYLSRGIALYNSLELNCDNFHLYIFAFDSNCYNKLKILDLKNVTIISLNTFENEDLLRIKPTRTAAEYCWTSTSSTILYCLTNFDIDNCTYLDADMYFYSSPIPIFEEIGDASIALTEHHYTKKYDQSATCGKYCVQFVFFRNDNDGIKALKWWKDACIDWCFARLENGKFGDQKYLDDWTEKFDNVHVINNLGAGVAPWNIQQYEFVENNNSILINKAKNETFDMIFYHFHALNFKIYEKVVEIERIKMYLSDKVLQKIYLPYLNNLIEIENSQNPILNKSTLIFNFKKHSLIIKLYIPFHFILKKIEVFRSIKRYFVKSSR